MSAAPTRSPRPAPSTVSCASHDRTGNYVIPIIDLSAGGEQVVRSLTGHQWYYIAVAGRADCTGNYTLTVDGPALTTTAIGASTSGVLAYGGDTNYYSFVVPAGMSRAQINATPAAGVNTAIEVYSSSGTLLGICDNAGEAAPDWMANVVVSAGSTYYIAIHAQRTQTGMYSVGLQFSSGDSQGDPSATIPVSATTGTWLTADSSNQFTASGAIQTGIAMDLYAINPISTGSFTITTTGSLNSQLRIYDRLGNAITPVVDSGSTGESTTLTLTGGSWYYIAVAGSGFALGSYSLTIAGPLPGPTSITVPAPHYDGVTSDSLAHGGDMDLFQVTAPAGTDTLDLSVAPVAGLNTTFRVYNSAGALIATCDSGGTGVEDATSISASAGSTYFITVLGATRTSSGTYDLYADFSPDMPVLPLTVTGTAGNDTVALTLTQGVLSVTRNGTTNTYAAAGVLNITIDCLAGNDQVTVGAGVMAVTIQGGDGNDSIRGGDYGDFIQAGSGDDSVWGNGGDDTLYGNFGNDSITAGAGNDSLMGGLDNDTLDGGIGRDSLYGGNGTDSLSGGSDNDYIEGRGKADTIHGDDGNDTIYGGAGSDLIYGDAGNDAIYGLDTLVFQDSLDGGLGTDSYTADTNDVLTSVETLVI